MLLFFFVILYLCAKCNTTPLLIPRGPDNVTAEADPSWVSSPNVRGTFDLVLACLMTLSLCAWTAYHPNVNSASSLTGSMLRRLWWMVIVIFVPEVVLFCAWDQLWTARRLQRKVASLGQQAFDGTSEHRNPNSRVQSSPTGTQPAAVTECFVCSGANLCDEDGPSASQGPPQQRWEIHRRWKFHNHGSNVSPSDMAKLQKEDDSSDQKVSWYRAFMPRRKADTEIKDNPWTIEQAFFAVSGGFAVDSCSFSSQPQLTFTPLALLSLAKHGLLPNASVATVSDKSKADVVAKVLVCLQAGWFLVQSIARLARGLPLTLLEVHVLAHVACAFCMYLFWINKPYDVTYPIISDNEAIVDIAALYALRNKDLGYTGEWKCAQLHSLKLSEVQGALPNTSKPSNRSRFAQAAKVYFSEQYNPPETPTHPAVLPALTRDENCAPKLREHLLRANRALQRIKVRGDHFRWLSITETYRVEGSDELHYQAAAGVRFEEKKAFLVPVRSNLRMDGLSYGGGPETVRGREFDLQARIMIIFSGLYGGAHLLAWRTHFPSDTEMWMWRSAGIVMAVAPLSIAIFESSTNWSKRWAPSPTERMLGLHGIMRVTWILDHLLDLLVACQMMIGLFAWLLYPAARLYILVEAFISLRSPPAGTYKTVEWSSFVPHIG